MLFASFGSSDLSVTSFPSGSFPVTVAWFSTLPAFISSAVNVYVVLNVVSSLSPILSEIGPPLTVTNGSATVTSLKSTFPVLVTLKV